MLKDRLKELRKENKLLQSEMAEKLEISQSAYSHYEQGKRIPDSITLHKMADILNTTTDYLLGRTNKKELAIMENDEIPQELKEIGIEYLEVNKELKEKGFTPEKIRNLIKSIEALNKK